MYIKINEVSVDLISILALWGAMLSTILAVIEAIKFYYEGVRIKVDIKNNFTVFPKGPLYGDKTVVLITASNKGRRSTTITHVWLLGPKNINFLVGDCIKRGAIKLEEGGYAQYITVEEEVKKSGLMPRDYVAVVSDATGRKFYSHFIFKRWFKKMRMNLFTKAGKAK